MSDNKIIFCNAVKNGQVTLVQQLIEEMTLEDKNKCLLIACKEKTWNHVQIAKLLIEAEADVNFEDNDTPLTALCENITIEEQIDLIEILIERGANVNLLSCENDAENDIYVSQDINVDEDYDMPLTKFTSALHLVVSDNQYHVAKLLLQAGADVNIQDWDSHTPILTGCLSSHFDDGYDTVELLVNAGAIVNVQETAGFNYTPLHYAVENANFRIADLLLKNGADVNRSTVVDGIVPLLLVPKVKVDQMVLQCFENLVRDTENSTVYEEKFEDYFYKVASFQNKEMLEILFRHGMVVGPCDQLKALRSVVSGCNADSKAAADAFNYLWDKTNKNIFKEDNGASIIDNMINFDWYVPHKILCFFKVLNEFESLPFCKNYLFKLAVSAVERSAINLYSCFNNANVIENLDSLFKSIDFCSVVQKFFEKGVKLESIKLESKDLEGLIYLCSKYFLLNDVDGATKFLNVFINNNINLNDKGIMQLAVANCPLLSVTLLQYCIVCDPMDIFENILLARRVDTMALKLIEKVLRLCTPSEEIQRQCVTFLEHINDQNNNNYRELKSGDYLVPVLNCVKTEYSEEEKEKEKKFVNYLLDVLALDRFPTLKELSRNKVRELLKENCSDTKTYLKSIKHLDVPSDVKKIIQCQKSVCSFT